MWEYQEWMCIHCGWILKFAIGRTDVYTWCDKCHEPLDKIREVRKNHD